MVDNELITKVRVRNVKSILSNVFQSSGGGTLTSGNGTTANGTAVDLGGDLTGDVTINGASTYSVNLGGLFSASPLVNFNVYSASDVYFSGNGGSSDFSISPAGSQMTSTFTNSLRYNGTELNLLLGITDGVSAEGFQIDNSGTIKLRIPKTGSNWQLNLGSDATGDTYYRNSSGYFTRLAAGTNGHVLTLSGGIPSWAAPSGGISGLTTGRIPFAASATTLTDDATLAWDNTDKKLTFGTHFAKSHSTGLYMGKTVGSAGMSGGVYNVVIGEDAGLAFTSAARNILLGHDAGRAITSAHYNIAIGEAALRLSTTSGENVGIGYRALYQATGEDNVGIGFGAGMQMSGSGRNNIFMGYYAGAQSGASGTNAYTDGDHSIFIGSYAYAPNATEDSQINIGNTFFARGNSGSNPIPDVQTGRVGIFIDNPTARLHVPATTATANTASLKIPSGTLLTTPEAGAVEADANALYWTNNAGTRIDLSGTGFSDPMTTRGDIIIRNAANATARLGVGANTYVLTSDGTDVSWAAPSGGGSSVFSDLTAAAGANTINNAANAQEWQWNTLGAGTGLLLSSSSTAAASNTNTLFRVNQTGANATSTQTTYSGYFSNTKTGTSATNVGLFTTATGGSTNLALHALGGIRLETTASNYVAVKSTSGAEWFNFDNARVVYLNSAGSSDRITPTSGTLAFLAANATAIDHYTFTGSNALTATSGTARMMVLSKGITVSSGTTTFTALDVTGTYNITGGTLTVNGIKYAPTLTSMTGATHYFINAASGRVLLGGLPTSSAGLATGEIWNNSGVINIV